MKTDVLLKLTVSAACLALVTVGCKPAGSRPASLSSSAPSSSRDAAKAASKAMAAINERKADVAIVEAEKAVSLAPRDAGYRAMLGQAYLIHGRFASAQAAFSDALALHSEQPHVGLSLALTEIAMGRGGAAQQVLDGLEGKVAEADRGLAYALAGEVDRGVTILESAARAPGAGAKARQNLGLAYAMAGRWGEARSIAAQDLPADQISRRMLEWAMFAKPRQRWDQVASLLGVRPGLDAGMPVALALAPTAPAAEPVALAQAEPQPQPEATAAPVVAPEPVIEPVALAEAAPPAPIETAAVPEYVAPEPTPTNAQPLLQAAVATNHGVTPVPTLIAAPRSPIKVAYVVPVRKPASVVQQRAKGGFVVQLGAYSTASRVETAWNRIAARVQMIEDYVPSTGTFDLQHTGTVYRLSLAGFATRAAAVDLCERVRAKGGECFVRASFDDRPVQWVSRRKAKGEQLAMR
ncbi:hypothetical protein ACFB49_20800 [Sphingomonas sp. DBB INV C78]|uniref:SPOR domain-containing protein n=1 Tax=Sphingomonas sp. DBB INV C78 TaxID=3349434 RepID=UPI0036D21F9A